MAAERTRNAANGEWRMASDERDTLAEPASARTNAGRTLAFRTLFDRRTPTRKPAPATAISRMNCALKQKKRPKPPFLLHNRFRNHHALWRVLVKGSSILIICA